MKHDEALKASDRAYKSWKAHQEDCDWCTAFVLCDTGKYLQKALESTYQIALAKGRLPGKPDRRKIIRGPFRRLADKLGAMLKRVTKGKL